MFQFSSESNVCLLECYHRNMYKVTRMIQAFFITYRKLYRFDVPNNEYFFNSPYGVPPDLRLHSTQFQKYNLLTGTT